jgi:hypothetical protein
MFILITETLFAADSYEMPLPEERREQKTHYMISEKSAATNQNKGNPSAGTMWEEATL